MASDRSILEHQMAAVEVRPFTIEEFHRRRHQRQRNRRTGTTLAGLLLVAAVVGGVLRTVGSDPGDTRVTSDDTPSDEARPSTVAPAAQMESVRDMVDAINTRDTDAFLGTFAPQGSFDSRGDFRESTGVPMFGHRLNVRDVDLVSAFLDIVDAWGLEAELVACAPRPVTTDEPADVDAVVELSLIHI